MIKVKNKQIKKILYLTHTHRHTYAQAFVFVLLGGYQSKVYLYAWNKYNNNTSKKKKERDNCSSSIA